MYNQKSKTKKFINEIIQLCEKFQLSISHEDTQGAFIIEKYSKTNIEWFESAFDKTVNQK